MNIPLLHPSTDGKTISAFQPKGKSWLTVSSAIDVPKGNESVSECRQTNTDCFVTRF